MNELYERILLLKRVPLFERLRTDQLRWVAGALEPVAWVRGETVFDKGDPSDAMYVILEGRIGISLQRAGDRAQQFVAELGAGACLGEMGVVDGLPRSGSAHVLADTRALMVEKDRLVGLMHAYPELAIGILRGLSLKLRELNEALGPPRG